MSLDLNALGLTIDQLQEMVVDKLVKYVLENNFDPDHFSTADRVHNLIGDEIKSAVNKTIHDIANQHIVPRVDSIITSLVIPNTNNYGEKKCDSMTFIEYLLKQADAYLTEEVNPKGLTRKQSSGYSFDNAIPRIQYLIKAWLDAAIYDAVKQQMGKVNSAILDGLKKVAAVEIAKL